MLTRHVQRATLIAGAVIAALLFFLGGAALRLAMGPISLGPFGGAIEDSINRSMSGLVVRFDQAVLEWSRDEGKINLVVLGTRVFDLNGRIVAQAPKADLVFDAAALVGGRLSLKRIALIGVQLTGIRGNDGSIRLGFGPERGEANILDTLTSILNSNSGGGTLDNFSIKDARLAFQDQPTGLFIVSPNASFTLENKNHHLDVALDSAVEISGVPAHLSARAILSSDGKPQRGTLTVRGLSLAALAANDTLFKALKPYQLTSDLDAEFTLGPAGTVTAANFSTRGSGRIQIQSFKTPFDIAGFSVQGRYDAQAARVTLDDIEIKGAHLSGKAKADLTLGWKDGAPVSVAGAFDGRNLVLNLPENLSQPLAFSRFAIKASYDANAHKLSWQHAILNGGAFSADVSGEAAFTDGHSPALKVNGTVAALGVRDLLKIWPLDVADGARAWIDENIPEGRLGPFAIAADLPSGTLDGGDLPDAALNVRFPFSNMTAHYLGDMTPITGAAGDATLTGDNFRVTMRSAAIGPLTVSQGVGSINDLHTSGAPGHFKVHVDGKMPDVLMLVDQQPLGYAKRFGIDPISSSGQAGIDLDITLPLLKDLPLERLGIGVQAKIVNLAVPIDARRKLDHGMVTLAIDTKSLSAQGTGNISGVPADFKWTEDFSAAGITTRIDVAAKLDDASRAALGLAQPDWVTGPMAATLNLTGRRFHFSEGLAKADLTNASAKIAVLNIEKRAGRPANASATLHFADDGAVAVRDLVVTGENLDVRGGLDLDGDGNLADITATRVKAGANNDFVLTGQAMPGGGLSLRLQGASADASQIFANDATSKTPGAPADDSLSLQNPLTIDATLQRVAFRDNFGFRNLALAVSFAGKEKLTALALNADGLLKGKVSGRLTVDKGVRNLAIDSDDAGSLIDTFTGFSSIKGGTLAARINFPSDRGGLLELNAPDYAGTLTLSNFTVANQPFLARLFSAGSLDGPLRLMQGQGIAVSKFEAPFSARGKVVTLKEGRASGPAIGATFSGVLDRAQDHIDVSGSLVPIYALNSVLGSVPVIGDILVSKKGEGIIGLTYAMKGNLEEPSISVNPLSVLTPGILRRVFEFGTPKTATAPQPQAAAQPTAKAPDATAPATE